MHLSLEFALLMSRSDIHVFALREYFTKALMPLDREPHKQMQLSWSHLKTRFAAEHGHSVTNQFQALAIIREAWAAATLPKHIASAWKQTGIVPWSPDELLVNQAQSLFRSEHQVARDHKFMDPTSKAVLALPSTMMEKKTTCKSCKSTILLRFRHCTDCGSLNEAFSTEAAQVMKDGRRKGFKKIRPNAFNIEELMGKNFEGLRAVSDAGKVALEDGSSSSSDSTCTSEDDSVPKETKSAAPAAIEAPSPAAPAAKETPKPAAPAAKETPKPAAPAAKAPAPAAIEAPSPAAPAKYDPPTYIPSQLKSQTTLKRAWLDVLADVDDPKHKKAFVHWVPEFMELAKTEIAKKFEKGTPKEVIYKSLLDRVAKKNSCDRQKWYNERVKIMLESLEKQAAKKLKTK